MKEEFHYMRTLKKTLALVLVVAMVLSFGIIGASADFTDVKADNDYKEAIDVLVGIGVINGMDNGKFEPDGSLTRAQAAKIIAYLMLGATNAENMSNAAAQKFDDVPTSHWAAGYIEYAANLGIINGVGDNKFDPEAALSSAAFTKMLLVALGYQAGTENLTGESWVINTATLAVSAGISDSDISVSATRTITRAEAAQLAFKALQARTVKYTGGTSMEVNGITITSGAVRSYVENTKKSDYRGETNGDEYMQFCEQYFPKLTKTNATKDDFGRPSTYQWKLSNRVIASGSKTPDLVYTTQVTGGTIYSDLGLTANLNDANSVTTYTDGTATSQTTTDMQILRGDTGSNAKNKFGGNGAVTEVYYDADSNTAIIVIITPYLGVISAVRTSSAANDAYVTVVPASADAKKVSNFASGNFDTTGFNRNDVVLYTVAKTGNNNTSSDYVVKSVSLAKSDNLTATSVVTSGTPSFVSGGTTYKYSAGFDTTKGIINDFNAHTVYFDNYGYVLGTDSVAGASEPIMLVYNAGQKVTDWGVQNDSHVAGLLYSDGTMRTVDTGNVAATKGKLVKATVNNGIYTLTNAGTSVNASELKLTNGVSRFTWGNDVYYANANTVFYVKTGTTNNPVYTAYVGIANVPGFNAGQAKGEIVGTSGNVVTAVYIENAIPTGTTTSDRVFVSNLGVQTVRTSTGDYYVANAVVNGDIQQLNLVNTPTAGVYNSMSTSSDGLVSLGATVSNSFTNQAIIVDRGTIYIPSTESGATTRFGYTSDVAVYMYTATGIEVSSLSAIGNVEGSGNNVSYDGFYTTTTAGVIDAIYLTVHA